MAEPLDVDLSQRLLGAGEFVFATASSALRPGAWSRAVAPARYIAMPSVAYRLARVAAGDGVATLSIHSVNEYDIAAGMALIRGAGGVTLDAEGKRPVFLEGILERRLSGCFAGAPAAAAQLAAHDWKSLENEPPLKARVALGFPRKAPQARLARAQGCLLGQVIGDSLGSLVEFKSAAEIARLYPAGVRELADGGVYHTIAGQPTDDSEMALALARCLVANKEFLPEKVLDAYRDWMTTRPVDIGTTTERGLLGLNTTDSESNGSLMRVLAARRVGGGRPGARRGGGAPGLGAHAQEPGMRRGLRRLRRGDRRGCRRGEPRGNAQSRACEMQGARRAR